MTSDRTGLLALLPELAAAHDALVAELWARGDAVVLELCRLRMATLLGASVAYAERSPAAVVAGLTEDLAARLPAWPHDPAFTDAHRVALAFTEQWTIDHHGITDAQVVALQDVLGAEGVVVLTTALGVWDNQHRFDLALDVIAP